jgi:hypothetical protein
MKTGIRSLVLLTLLSPLGIQAENASSHTATARRPATTGQAAPSAQGRSTDNCYIRASIKLESRLNRSELANYYVLQLNNRRAQDRIRELYDLDANTYEKLYRLAFGILGAETKFGRSPKYWVKERFPWLTSSLKEFRNEDLSVESLRTLRSDIELGLIHETLAQTDSTYSPGATLPELFDLSQNSRGPTQIKYFPERLAEAFPEINKGNLDEGSRAAIATMAYLAEALPRLKAIAAKNNCVIPEDRLVDHLVYLYTGRSGEIINCTATIDRNLYYQKVVKAQEEVVFSRSEGCEEKPREMLRE